jgi:translation initiation factor IF-3
VRLIGKDGEQLGIVLIGKALQIAASCDLDLVEVAPTANPPVCRVMDFGKFNFEQEKKLHAAKKKQRQVQVKEIKFRPGTGENDYQVKLRSLIRFLEEGDRAKITLRFRGREMIHRDLGERMLERLLIDLAEHGTVEQTARLEGRQITMMVVPKRK